MQSLGYLLLGVACVVAASFVRPTRATCPSGRWWVNGIRPSGEFSCMRTLDVEGEGPSDAELAGRLYCMGTIPVVVSEHAVECRSW